MDRSARIAVIGAGLGGLAAAGFLQRAGFRVAIYEQAASFSRIGAGIILSANVVKVLRRLDLEDRVVRAGIRPDAFVSRAWDTGEELHRATFDEESERAYGGPYINIHRGDLHAVMERAVLPGTVVPGRQLEALDRAGEGLRLAFAGGASAEADVVVGADGLRSRVRDVLLGPEPPRFVGKVAQRAIFPAERLAGNPIADCTKWWGEDKHVLAYYVTPRRDEVYVIGVVPERCWAGGEAARPCPPADFRACYDGWHPDLLRVVEAADEITAWPIYDRARDDRWTGDRVALLGDACHPMRPFMAAGGAMAIEDAAILSRCLVAFDDPADALDAYEATRVERVGRVQDISIENSWMRGPTEAGWFYRYDACTAPLARPRRVTA